MQYVRILLLIVWAVTPLLAQTPGEGPADEKARKTYQKAVNDLKNHMVEAALESSRRPINRMTGTAWRARRK